MIFPPEFLVFLLAMAPISELRGAIPTGVAIFGLSFWKVFCIAFFGNLIPVALILLFLEPVSKFLRKNSKFFDRFFNWLFEKTRKKVSPKIKNYEKLGLTLFVAIPLPITGGWTGAVAAFLLGLPFKVAFPLITIGVFIAGVIVSILTLSGVAIGEVFGWVTFVLAILVILFFYFLYKLITKK
ncbi:MAG: small multi-drug export protein [Candidatus Pacebacteria bacterium]|nr:small multi-drug export protein [Candidatus Paceibacterota bacterium]